MTTDREKTRRLEEVAGPVSRETAERLIALEAFFLKWAGRINLAAPSTLKDVWERHIIDSAQIAPLSDAADWVDLGSGGGFPGLVIGAFLRERPGAHIHLIESNQKKSAYLRSAAAELDLLVTVHARRIEAVESRLPRAATVTARALAPLDVLLSLSVTFLGRGLFHKGRDYRKEVELCRDRWDFDLIERPSRLTPDSVILDISNVRRR